MGLFSKIRDAIFRQSADKPDDARAAGAGPSRVQKRQGIDRPVGQGAAASSLGPDGGSVDIQRILDDMESKNSQDLDWRHSIVDLMKLVGMDSSLAERRELADELGYQGDKGDTATMNMWLHKQVMRKLQENGGRVPQELLD